MFEIVAKSTRGQPTSSSQVPSSRTRISSASVSSKYPDSAGPT